MSNPRVQQFRCGRCGRVAVGPAAGLSAGAPICRECMEAVRAGGLSEAPTRHVGGGPTLMDASGPPAGETHRTERASVPVQRPKVTLEQITGPAEPELGVLLGPYRLISIVGRGGMGIVYKAQDTVLERDVALKLLSAATPESRERFLREARLAAGLSHQNIVTVHHVGEHSGIPYIVTELMTGGSLTSRIRTKGKLTALEACRVGAAAARALDYGHKRQIIHRDVKPPNLLIAPDGSVKLGDFGLARSLNDSMELTRSGSLMGTPQYVAPELCVGETATAVSDIYALGCTLYFLLAGEHPFKADSVYQVLYMQVHTPFPDIRQKVPGLPATLTAAITRAVAKKPSERWPTAGALADELDQVAEEIVTGRGRGGGGGGFGRVIAWLAACAVLATSAWFAYRYISELGESMVPPSDRTAVADSDKRRTDGAAADRTKPSDGGVRDGRTVPDKDKRAAADKDKAGPTDKDRTASTDKDKSRPPDPPPKDRNGGNGKDKDKGKATVAEMREQFARLMGKAEAELNDGWQTADPRQLASAIKSCEDALNLISDDMAANSRLQDARAKHAKVVQYHALLAEAETAVGSRKPDAAVTALSKAVALAVPDRDQRAQTRLAEIVKRRENTKKALALRDQGTAALEKKNYAAAEKLLQEAAALLADNDPDRIAIRQTYETARVARESFDAAAEEMRKVTQAAVDALSARDSDRLLRVLFPEDAAAAPAAAAALCDFLRGYSRIEVRPVGEPLRFAEPDPFGPTTKLVGKMKLVLSDDLGGGRTRRLELPLGEPFVLVGLPGSRKPAARPWLTPVPAFAAREQAEMHKVLAELGSLQFDRVARHLAAPAAPALKNWLAFVELYASAAREQGRNFEITQRPVRTAWFVGEEGEPDEALVAVDVGFGGIRTVRLLYRFRKDAGVWKLVEQRRAGNQ